MRGLWGDYEGPTKARHVGLHVQLELLRVCEEVTVRRSRREGEIQPRRYHHGATVDTVQAIQVVQCAVLEARYKNTMESLTASLWNMKEKHDIRIENS